MCISLGLEKVMDRIQYEIFIHLRDWTSNLLSAKNQPDSWYSLGQYLQSHHTVYGDDKLISLGLMIEEAVRVQDQYILSMIGNKLHKYLEKLIEGIQGSNVKAS